MPNKLTWLFILLVLPGFLAGEEISSFPKNHSWEVIEQERGSKNEVYLLIDKSRYFCKLKGDFAIADSLSSYAVVVAQKLDKLDVFVDAVENYFDCATIGQHPDLNHEIIHYFDQQKSNSKRWWSAYFRVLIHLNEQQFNEAIEAANVAELLAKDLNDKRALAKSYVAKGLALQKIGVSERKDVRYEAFSYFLNAREGYMLLEDYRELAKINTQISHFFYAIDKEEEYGYQYNEAAFEAFSKLEHADSLLYLDILFQRLLLGSKNGSDSLYAELEKWINFADEREYDQFKNDIFSIYRTSLISSGNYARLENTYLTQFREEFDEIRRKKTELYFRIRAYGFEAKSNLDSADHYWEKAIAAVYDQHMGDKEARITNSFIRYAEYLVRTHRTEKGVGVLLDAWHRADSLDIDFFRLRIAESLTEGYIILEDYQSALHWKTIMLELRHNIDQETSGDRIRIAEVENDAQKQQAVLEAENEQKSRETFFFQLAFALFLVLSGFAFYQYRLTRKEKQRSDDLLLNILPEKTAAELRTRGITTAKRFNDVTILFADIVGFSKVAENLAPGPLVEVIDRYFKAFDEIAEVYGLEKIKTIGDAYLAVGGLPEGNAASPEDTVKAALSMQRVVNELNEEGRNEPLGLRIGINTGDVVAGVVGSKKFQFDIWGDAVNVAARMEQASEPGKVNVSKSTYEKVKEGFDFTSRGKIEAKNKGALDMYFVQLKQ